MNQTTKVGVVIYIVMTLIGCIGKTVIDKKPIEHATFSMTFSTLILVGVIALSS